MTRPRRGYGLAVLITLVQLAGTAIVGASDLDLRGYALLAAGGLALAARHRFPRATLVVVAAATVAYHVLGYPFGPTFLALVVAGAVAAKAGNGGLVFLTGVGSYATWIVLDGPSLGRALVVAAVLLVAAILTGMAHGAARMMRQMEEEQRRSREERHRRQASEERLRIAQELHDVLGHHLSLINVRAGVGGHLMDRDPEQARAALDTIKQASAEALREVQSVLNTLYPTDGAAPRMPAPGLARLDELTVDAGLRVRTVIAGEPRPLPAEVDRAAYRIVQEALTNVRRHAGEGADATVLVGYADGQVLVEIENSGAAGGSIAPPAAEGSGISGMRERAAAFGGSLTAGPLPTGGWRVRATLSLPDVDAGPRPEEEAA